MPNKPTATARGSRGAWVLEIDGVPLRAAQGHERRFVTLDAAARAAARMGAELMTVSLADAQH